MNCEMFIPETLSIPEKKKDDMMHEWKHQITWAEGDKEAIFRKAEGGVVVCNMLTWLAEAFWGCHAGRSAKPNRARVCDEARV